MSERKKNWIFFTIILLLFLFLDIAIAILYMFFINSNKLTFVETMVITFLKYISLFIIFFTIYKDYLKEKWIDFKKHFAKYFEISFKYWFVGFIIMITSNMIINRFISGLGENEAGIQELITEAPIIAFILTTICAPFIEEMVFRKSLQNCFKNKVYFMITSGLLFGLIHVIGSANIYEYLLIIPYGALGFMFAKTINETDNIYCTIMMHLLHNGILTLIAIIGL